MGSAEMVSRRTGRQTGGGIRWRVGGVSSELVGDASFGIANELIADDRLATNLLTANGKLIFCQVWGQVMSRQVGGFPRMADRGFWTVSSTSAISQIYAVEAGCVCMQRLYARSISRGICKRAGKVFEVGVGNHGP